MVSVVRQPVPDREGSDLDAEDFNGSVAPSGSSSAGGLSYLRTTAVERFYRDAYPFRLYEGSSEMQRLIIGSAVLREAGMAHS